MSLDNNYYSSNLKTHLSKNVKSNSFFFTLRIYKKGFWRGYISNIVPPRANSMGGIVVLICHGFCRSPAQYHGERFESNRMRRLISNRGKLIMTKKQK